MRPFLSLATAALLLSQSAAASDKKFVQLDELEPARDRVVYVEPPQLRAATVVATRPWGVLQTVQIPVSGPVERLHASGKAVVHVAPATEVHLTVKTDPGLLHEARTTLTEGTLRVQQVAGEGVAAWHFEGPAPASLHLEDDAHVEVAAWEGDVLEIVVRGDAQLDLGHVRARSLRVVARDAAQVRITGACKVDDLWVDTAVDARFDGCGFRQGG